MIKGISMLSCIPVRKTANERTEMVTQILFGEVYEILEKDKKFAYIRLLHDGYEGWLSNNMITFYKNEDNNKKHYVNTCLLSKIKNKLENRMYIIPGASSLYNIDFITNSFIINEIPFSFDETIEFNNEQNAFDLAKIYIGTPYLWGGRTLMGIDCSGLVQNVFKMKGVMVPRDVSEQVKQGHNINDILKSKKGDLAFFINSENKLSHVGILDGNGNIIHSSGNVKIEIISNEGIVNNITGEISHKLHSIKRIELT